MHAVRRVTPLLLLGCNAVLGIQRHEYAGEEDDDTSAGGALAAAGGAGRAGTAGRAATVGSAGGSVGTAGSAGSPDGGLSGEDAFLARWSFDSMNGDQVPPSAGSAPPLIVQGATLSEGPTGNYLLMLNSRGSAVSASTVLDASRSFSISIWVRLDRLDTWNTFVSQDGQTISSFYLQKRDTNSFAFTTFALDNTAAKPCIAEAAMQPKAGEWYHVAATRDATSGQQRIYVDGVLSGEATCAGGFKTTGPLVVGRGQWETPADWMTGAVDELSVANRALSAKEIVELYREGRPDARHYLFAYFVEAADGQGDGLHFAYSHDALSWGEIGVGKLFLRSTVGGRSFRDPHVMRDPFGTYHVVWTTTCVPWANADCVQDHGFGHTTSKDLVTFADPSYIEIPRDELNVEHVWAPETFYDSASAQYLVTWASPLDLTPGADPHGIYYMLTKDFITFSEPALLYGRPGADFIDATLVKQGDLYLMFLKGEAAGQKNLRVLASKSLFGASAWLGDVSAPLTGAYAAEGPSVLVSDGRMLLYFDKYAEQRYGVLRSRSLSALTDPAQWEDISSSLMSKGLRHGSVIEVPFDVLRAIAIRAAQ
jgi:hypothetical protein